MSPTNKKLSNRENALAQGWLRSLAQQGHHTHHVRRRQCSPIMVPGFGPGGDTENRNKTEGTHSPVPLLLFRPSGSLNGRRSRPALQPKCNQLFLSCF